MLTWWIWLCQRTKNMECAWLKSEELNKMANVTHAKLSGYLKKKHTQRPMFEHH